MSSRNRTEKVSLSFSNWVLGGSLVSVKSVESPPPLPLPKRTARKMVIVEVDSDGNEIRPIHLKPPKAKEATLQGEKKEDGDDKKEEEKEHLRNICKTCKACKICKGPRTSSEKKDNCTVAEPGSSAESKCTKSKTTSKQMSENGKNNHGETNIQNVDQIDRSGGWTETQDETIINMKDANKSWKEIAAEVGATKKEVTERFRLLQKYAESLFNNDDDQDGGGGGNYTGIHENHVSGEFDCRGLFGDDDNNAEKHQGQNQDNSKNSSKKNKRDKQQQQQQRYEGSGQYERYEPDADNHRGETFRNAYQDQRRGSLQPDRIWDRETCELLEFLEAKHEEGKWMHLQAGFYNWTGRMVSAEMIEKKFRDDSACSR